MLGVEMCATRLTTGKQRKSGRRIGTSVNQNFYDCRNHLKRDGSVGHRETFFCCSTCKIPLCRENKIDRVSDRTMNYLKEHANSEETHRYCDDCTHWKNFPMDRMIN